MDACRPRRAARQRGASIDHGRMVHPGADREKRFEGVRRERRLSPVGTGLVALTEGLRSPFSQCRHLLTARTHLDSAHWPPHRANPEPSPGQTGGSPAGVGPPGAGTCRCRVRCHSRSTRCASWMNGRRAAATCWRSPTLRRQTLMPQQGKRARCRRTWRPCLQAGAPMGRPEVRWSLMQGDVDTRLCRDPLQRL
jgi:hypothetical protein